VRQICIATLIKKFSITEAHARLVKERVKRKAIDAEVAQRLLDESNFTCCVCRGTKSTAFLLHHITPYEKTQDNGYHNLAVLCPACHDLAHRVPGLSSGITAKDVRRRKAEWCCEIQNRNAFAAASTGRLAEMDFVNVERVTLLLIENGATVPQLTPGLLGQPIGLPSDDFQKPYDALTYKAKLGEAFLGLVPKLGCRNLDEFWTRKAALSTKVIGLWTYYCGGLYGTSPDFPVTAETQPTRLHLRRRGISAQWLFSPINLLSTTACSRLGQHSIYLVYGRIRSVNKILIKGREHRQFDIRPYVFGSPQLAVQRVPAVAYLKSLDFVEEELEEERFLEDAE